MSPMLDGSASLRTPLLRLRVRAKLETWPKLWQNLRSSCSSDWAREFGAAAESEWAGAFGTSCSSSLPAAIE
jgi:hypothetical protein